MRSQIIRNFPYPVIKNKLTLLKKFSAPKHWPTWLVIIFTWCCTWLPYSQQLAVGRVIGRLFYLLPNRRKQIAAINLGLCFPDWTPEKRETVLKQHFESLGISIIETAVSWWAPAERLPPVVLEGREHLDDALAKGKGVILLSSHVTVLEITGRLLLQFTPMHAMYREHSNPLFEAVMQEGRREHTQTLIPRRDIRSMMRSLKNNFPVWYAPDQDYGREQSIFVPFFGVQTATITATSRFARMSEAAIVPFVVRRLPGTQGYALTLFPALENFPSDDVATDTRRINEVIERAVLMAPEQYLWVHRRFKTRPPGQPGYYPFRKRRASRKRKNSS